MNQTSHCDTPIPTLNSKYGGLGVKGHSFTLPDMPIEHATVEFLLFNYCFYAKVDCVPFLKSHKYL